MEVQLDTSITAELLSLAETKVLPDTLTIGRTQYVSVRSLSVNLRLGLEQVLEFLREYRVPVLRRPAGYFRLSALEKAMWWVSRVGNTDPSGFAKQEPLDGIGDMRPEIGVEMALDQLKNEVLDRHELEVRLQKVADGLAGRFKTGKLARRRGRTRTRTVIRAPSDQFSGR